jgi:transposase
VSAPAADGAAALQLTAQQFEALVVGLPWQRLPQLEVISRA